MVVCTCMVAGRVRRGGWSTHWRVGHGNTVLAHNRQQALEVQAAVRGVQLLQVHAGDREHAVEDTVQVGHSTAARAAGDAHQQLPAQVQHVPTVDAHPCRPAAGQSGATRSVLQGIQTRPITGILVARTADCHMAFAGGRGRAGDADAHASQGPGDGWDLSLARLVTWDTQCSPVTTEDRRVLHKDSIGMLWQRRQGDYLAHSCTQRLYVCFVLLQGKVHVNCQPHLLQNALMHLCRDSKVCKRLWTAVLAPFQLETPLTLCVRPRTSAGDSERHSAAARCSCVMGSAWDEHSRRETGGVGAAALNHARAAECMAVPGCGHVSVYTLCRLHSCGV